MPTLVAIGVNHDPEHANQTLSPIFDKEKEQRRLKEAQLIGEIGSQAADIARTQGQIEATKAGRAELEKQGIRQPGDKATKEERAAYDKALTETAGYKTAQQKWGTGSAIQQGLQAATAAVQGLAGGNVGAAIAGAASPYLAEVIHNMTTDANGKVNAEANLIAHAVLGAVTSAASGNSALAGASGAVMGEYIAQQLYPGVTRDELNEEQRQTISALGTLAAGLAGGLAGDSTADAVAGAQAGKNAVENNNLLLPRPVPMPSPGLPLSPGDKVVHDANAKLASELDKVLKAPGVDTETDAITDGPSIVEARNKADKSRNPNVAKDLKDAEKAEVGGSGTGTPGGFEPEKPKKDYKSELEKGDQIDLSTFNQRKAVSGSKGEFVDPKTGWKISPDRAGNNSHGGSAWKLLDKNGNRIATLDQNGNVLRK